MAVLLSEDTLLSKAQSLAGLNIPDFLQLMNLSPSLFHDRPGSRFKGLLGQLIEKFLGADAGNLSAPDFLQLGIELKTIPIAVKAGQIQVLESTYVCTLPSLQEALGQAWEQSRLKQKIRKILWVPIENYQTIGTSFLWEASESEDMQLKADWLEITDCICMGNREELTADLGVYLQVRPKAADSKVYSKQLVYNQAGELLKGRPQGFYFRARFTKAILTHCFF